MFSVENYNKQTIMLSNSLVIKLLDVAIAINKGLVLNYGKKIPHDKREWKYFMNLAGIKHETNNDVLVTVIELGEKRPLTRELLEKYQYTKNELLKTADVYNNLVNDYPLDIMYIHGCLYPVDIEDAINAKDGTILAYNKNFVELNEFSLLRELEIYIKDFLARWHVKEYIIVDELYLPSMLGVLYASIPSKIMNIRLERVHTNEAHSFHLEHFFRSKLDIWEAISICDTKTIYWLYKNLPYIMNNIGKEKTFKMVVKNILNPNGVGIGEYLLRSPNSQLNKDTGPFDPNYVKSDMMLTTSKLNSYYTDNSKGTITIDSIVARELNQANIELEQDAKEKNTFIVDDVLAKAKKTYRDNQKTKILEISTYQLFKRQGVDLFKLITDFILYLTNEDKIHYVAEFVEPNSNKNYILTGKTCILFLMKIILTLADKQDMKLTSMYYDTVLEPDPNSLLIADSLLYKDKYLDNWYTDLMDNWPNVLKNCTTVQDINYIINDVIDFYTYIWTLDANSESSHISANVKAIMNLITAKGEYVLTDNPDGMTIDELLEAEDLVYEITNTFDLTESLRVLIETFTGLDINEYNVIKEVSNGFKALVDSLTSYSVQVLLTDTGENTLYMHYNNTMHFVTGNGLAAITKAGMRPLDESYVHNDGMANDFIDRCNFIQVDNINIRTAEPPTWPIHGNCYIRRNEDLILLNPTIGVEMLKELTYGIDRVQYKNNFILDLKGSYDPIENTTVKSNAASNLFDADIARASVYSNPIVVNATTAKQLDWPITGYGQFDGNRVSNVNSPGISVEVLKDNVIGINKGEWIQKFILDLQGDMEVFAEGEPTVHTAMSNLFSDKERPDARGYGNNATPVASSGGMREKAIEMYSDRRSRKEDIVITNPVNQIEVVRDPAIGVDKIKDKDQFILGLDADFEVRPDVDVKLDLALSNMIGKEDSVTGSAYTNPNATLAASADQKKHPINMLVDTTVNNNDITYGEPTTQVEMVKDPAVGVDKLKLEEKFILDVKSSMSLDTGSLPILSSSKANTDENKPIYSKAFNNPTNLDAMQAYIKQKAVNLVPNIIRTDNLDVSTPSNQIEMVQDPAVGVDKIVDEDKFILGVEASVDVTGPDLVKLQNIESNMNTDKHDETLVVNELNVVAVEVVEKSMSVIAEIGNPDIIDISPRVGVSIGEEKK